MKSIFEIMGDLADRRGMTANYVGLMNMVYRVKDEYSVPMDQPFDLEAFANSVAKSLVDEEHDFEWFKEHGLKRRRRLKRPLRSSVSIGKLMTISRSRIGSLARNGR